MHLLELWLTCKSLAPGESIPDNMVSAPYECCTDVIRIPYDSMCAIRTKAARIASGLSRAKNTSVSGHPAIAIVLDSAAFVNPRLPAPLCLTLLADLGYAPNGSPANTPCHSLGILGKWCGGEIHMGAHALSRLVLGFCVDACYR